MTPELEKKIIELKKHYSSQFLNSAFHKFAEQDFEAGFRARDEIGFPKCSHGDYRMIGTDDCKRYEKCGGRVEIYVIGDGLCISCSIEQNKSKQENPRQ